MTDNFWAGFEKQAGIMSGVGSIGRTIGNVTGARQLSAGIKQIGHEVGRGANVTGGKLFTRPGISNRLGAAEKNLRQGGMKMLGTAAVGTAGVYGANKLMSSPQQQQ